MGGDSTKAGLNTRDIFLESAFFFPEAIAGRARRYNFASDASHRFERGVDFQNNVAGIERATRLILDICGGEPGPVVDLIARLPQRKPVRMRAARARKVIGVDLSAQDMAVIFQRLKLPFSREQGNEEGFWVAPPSYRFDLETEEDLIEEIARLYGYENIPAAPPVTRALMRALPEARRSLHEVRARLAAADYQETINFGFVDVSWEADFANDPAPIRVKNPIASHMSVMRSTLLGGLIANLQINLNRNLERIRTFEIGRVFLAAPGAEASDLEVAGYRQPTRVAGLAYGPAVEEQWGERKRQVDFFDVKNDLETLAAPRSLRFVAAQHPALHPGRSALVRLDGSALGWIGELHPRWQQKYELPLAPLLFEIDAEALLARPIPFARDISKFPLVRRDLAIVVEEIVTIDSILAALEGKMPDVVIEFALFDLYRGKGIEAGKKSLAFRVLMQDTEKTLKDEEVESVMGQIIRMLGSQVDAKLRS
jgi:phenylalanyl-tRNA synthetase beta chain